jgi:hypothetical protein
MIQVLRISWRLVREHSEACFDLIVVIKARVGEVEGVARITVRTRE